jgi:transposase-like protein
LERNILAQVKKTDKTYVASKIRPIFHCKDPETAQNELKNVVDSLKKRFPKAMQILEDSKDEILTFYSFFCDVETDGT